MCRWFHSRKNIKKSDVASGLENIFSYIHSSTSKPTRKVPPFQYFQTHYWDTHIAPVLTPALEAAYAKASEEGQELTSKIKKSIRMSVHQEVIKNLWVSLGRGFQDKVSTEAEAANHDADQQYSKLLEQPQSAEDYDRYVLSPHYNISSLTNFLQCSEIRRSCPAFDCPRTSKKIWYGCLYSDGWSNR